VRIEVPVPAQFGDEPIDFAVVLGSGLGSAGLLDSPASVAYTDIDGFPTPPTGVPGHAGMCLIGRAGNARVLVFEGRIHAYQGVSALDAAWPARVAAAAGARVLILTNAAGIVSPELSPGALMLLSDHINLTGDNPLVGWPGPSGGVPFVSMTGAYDPELRAIARIVAADEGIALAEGVYAGVLGPSFETPAEVRYLRAVGADAVGMSTIHEAIAARALGVRVMGISSLTNVAGSAGVSHAEVLEGGRQAAHALARLVRGVLARLDS
jgi:purine-nucleoside phosphorylase